MSLSGRAGHRFSQAPQPMQRASFTAGIFSESGKRHENVGQIEVVFYDIAANPDPDYLNSGTDIENLCRCICQMRDVPLSMQHL